MKKRGPNHLSFPYSYMVLHTMIQLSRPDATRTPLEHQKRSPWRRRRLNRVRRSDIDEVLVPKLLHIDIIVCHSLAYAE